jgi:hypothetical protein
MITWTPENELDLKNGIKRGLHPATSTRKNVLLCSYGNCLRVAWKEFDLPVFNTCDDIMERHFFCGPEHQAAQLVVWERNQID